MQARLLYSTDCKLGVTRHLGQVIQTQPTIGSNVEEIEHKNIKLQVIIREH